MDRQKILIVEDHIITADTLGYAVEKESMVPVVVYNGTDALAAFKEQEDISLVVLDINLPDISGFDLCRQMLKTRDTPIVFMTSRESELDEVGGLEMGADAYIKKPVKPRTMIAHIRAVLTRYNRMGEEEASEEKSTPHPDFTVNNDTKTITYKGQALELTASEFIILLNMILHPNRVFSREQIVAMIDEDIYIVSNSVTHRMKRLRNKLKKIDPDCDLLVSVRGLGYKLNP